MQREEAEVRRALAEAGPRPPLADDDVAAIEAAARQAWQRKVAEVRDEETSARMAGTARRASRWLRIAAVLLFALVAVVVWWTRDGGPTGEAAVARVESVDGALWIVGENGETPAAVGEAIPAGSALHGEAGGRASLRLASGTVVRLDEGSRLALRDANRLSLTAGAVYVDTDGGRGTAVTIETPLATVRDVGTSFTVRLTGSAEATRVEVAVRDGEVEVANGRTFGLTAGEAATVAADGTVERRSDPGFGPDWAWVLDAAPPYAVEGESLEEFLAWVEAETGWRVAYADPALAARANEIVLHGDIAGLRPDQAPFAVLPAANLAAELEDGVLTVRRR